MELDRVFRTLDVSASGLVAERTRLGVIARNITHASDTDRGDGTPYRRQEVVFAAALDGAMQGGVRVEGIVDDERTPHPRVSRPGHPHAGKDGMLTLPNVNTAFEMVDLLTASRAYEANLEVSQTLVRMAEQTLDILR